MTPFQRWAVYDHKHLYEDMKRTNHDRKFADIGDAWTTQRSKRVFATNPKRPRQNAAADRHIGTRLNINHGSVKSLLQISIAYRSHDLPFCTLPVYGCGCPISYFWGAELNIFDRLTFALTEPNHQSPTPDRYDDARTSRIDAIAGGPLHFCTDLGGRSSHNPEQSARSMPHNPRRAAIEHRGM